VRRFAIAPDIYMPLFGGYDVLAVARGATVPGNPRYRAVVNRRLYLFESEAARAAFAAGPGEAICHRGGEMARVAQDPRAVIAIRA